MSKKKTSDVILPHESASLTAGNALGLDASRRPSSHDKTVAAEYSQMIANSLKEHQVAQLLDISVNQVLERINQGSLYVIVTPSGYICPPFQFAGYVTLPGIEVVLAAINPRAHPLTVQWFFLTPNANLESKAGYPLSPREWLIQKYSLDPVACLVMEIINEGASLPASNRFAFK